MMINQPKYSDKNDCTCRNILSDMSELAETIAVIIRIRETEVRNLDLLILCILICLIMY